MGRIINHLKLTFATAKPPPSHPFEQVALLEAEERGSIVEHFMIRGERGLAI